MASEKEVTLSELKQYLQQDFGRRITEIIVHHTYIPTVADYERNGGLATVAGVRRYHMQVRGWSNNGYHVMLGPDAKIFLCRPVSRTGAHCLNHNARSVGVSYIGNFDSDDPKQYIGYQQGIEVVAAICKRFILDENDVYFHNTFANKTCPGTKFDLNDYREAVKVAMNGKKLKLVLLPGSNEIVCNLSVEEGISRVDLRPLVGALGYEVYPNHIAEQGKIYIREK